MSALQRLYGVAKRRQFATVLGKGRMLSMLGGALSPKAFQNGDALRVIHLQGLVLGRQSF